MNNAVEDLLMKNTSATTEPQERSNTFLDFFKPAFINWGVKNVTKYF